MYDKEISQVLKQLKTTKQGLTTEEAERRLKKYGRNEIKEKKRISAFKIFLKQFASPVVILLIVATIVSLFLKEFIDASAIFAILFLNSILGFIQEYRAEKTIQALKKYEALKARVIRDGKLQEIDASLLVPGDVIILNEGDKIPADARIIEEYNFYVQEAALTGESTAVKKTSKTIKKKITVIAEKKNIAFAGTLVVRGKAKAIVIATGMNTELGKIAEMISAIERTTPLQKKLSVLAKNITIITVAIIIITFLLGVFRKFDLLYMIIFSVSLGVAAIPEGLPAVVTISLTIGLKKLVKKNALIRHLPSVETLGSVTVICSDKTGTITKNEMTVKKIFANNRFYDVSGIGYSLEGEITYKGKKVKDKEIRDILLAALLCNDASLQPLHGDPTEIALLVAAAKQGLNKEELNKEYPRIEEIAFSSERKMMSTLHVHNNEKILFSKGAVEVLLKKCDRIKINNKILKLTEKRREEILAKNNELASKGYRILGMAYKLTEKLEEKNLIFLGFQAMRDPPREEVKEAIEKCNTAGIRVIMITGDHALTARAIAEEIGIKGKVMTGEELRKTKNLDEVIDEVSIFARVNPEDKLKIIEALRKRKHIIAMTGDGVNDAPALKDADIGIAVGSGTDVAKEASEMILLDDNFATIVNAVEEGRGIFNNIKKFVNYLLSCNVGEVLTIFVASLLFLPLPLAAIQLLWINLITDGLPALALGLDPPAKDIMQRKPRKTTEGIITKNMILSIITMGIYITLFILLLFDKFLTNVEIARTIAFTSFIVFESARIYTIKKQYNESMFRNKYLILALILSIILQLIVIYTPLAFYFKATELNLIHWIYMLAALVIFIILNIITQEIIKRITKEAD